MGRQERSEVFLQIICTTKDCYDERATLAAPPCASAQNDDNALKKRWYHIGSRSYRYTIPVVHVAWQCDFLISPICNR